MPFTEDQMKEIESTVAKFCEKRSPGHLKDKLRISFRIEKQSIFLCEIRPQWDNPAKFTQLDFAKMTYVSEHDHWKLYWRRASGKWELHPEIESSENLADLVKEIDADPLNVFFG